MSSVIGNATGLNTLTNQAVAMDLLVSAKEGIKLYALAATEAATPELKAIFVQHLNETIDLHEQVTAYLMDHGFYHPYDLREQIQLDQTNAQTALRIPL